MARTSRESKPRQKDPNKKDPRKKDPVQYADAGLKPRQRAVTAEEKAQREGERIERNRQSAARSRKKDVRQKDIDRRTIAHQDDAIARLKEALSKNNADLNHLHHLTDYQFRNEVEENNSYIEQLIATATYDESQDSSMDDFPLAESRSPSDSSIIPTSSTDDLPFSSQNSTTSLRNPDATLFLPQGLLLDPASERTTTVEGSDLTHISPAQLDLSRLAIPATTPIGSFPPMMSHGPATGTRILATFPSHGALNNNDEMFGYTSAQFVPNTGSNTVFVDQTMNNSATNNAPPMGTRAEANILRTPSFPSSGSSGISTDAFDSDMLSSMPTLHGNPAIDNMAMNHGPWGPLPARPDAAGLAMPLLPTSGPDGFASNAFGSNTLSSNTAAPSTMLEPYLRFDGGQVDGGQFTFNSFSGMPPSY